MMEIIVVNVACSLSKIFDLDNDLSFGVLHPDVKQQTEDDIFISFQKKTLCLAEIYTYICVSVKKHIIHQTSHIMTHQRVCLDMYMIEIQTNL